MAICCAPLTEILSSINTQSEINIKVEDETYLSNAIRDLKLAKAFDFLEQLALSFKHAGKAFKTIDSLVALRKSQGMNYEALLAPFYYKLGDYLASFIELNTDEFGNVKPLP